MLPGGGIVFESFDSLRDHCDASDGPTHAKALGKKQRKALIAGVGAGGELEGLTNLLNHEMPESDEEACADFPVPTPKRAKRTKSEGGTPAQKVGKPAQKPQKPQKAPPPEPEDEKKRKGCSRTDLDELYRTSRSIISCDWATCPATQEQVKIQITELVKKRKIVAKPCKGSVLTGDDLVDLETIDSLKTTLTALMPVVRYIGAGLKAKHTDEHYLAALQAAQVADSEIPITLHTKAYDAQVLNNTGVFAATYYISLVWTIHILFQYLYIICNIYLKASPLPPAPYS